MEISGDTVGLQSALKEVNQKSRDLQKELKDVERLLKFDPDNVEALAQKQKLLTEAVENTTKKLNQLKEAEEQVQAQFERGEISEQQYRAFRREIEFTEAQLRGFERRLEQVQQAEQETETRLEKLGKSFREAGDRAKESGEKIKGAGEAMSGVGESLMGITAAITAIGTGAVLSANQFEDAQAYMQASLGVTEQKAAELQQVAENVWKEGFGEDLNVANEAVSNLYHTVGDVPTAELQELVQGVLTLSDVFGTDYSENVTALNTVMTNFGLEGKQALDLITYATQQTGGVFRGDLADALTELAPTLTGMGATGQEAFNLLITASRSGMENFDALSSLTQSFTDTMLAGGEDVDKAFSQMGESGQKLWADYKAGNIDAYDLMLGTTDALKGMEDQQEKNKIGAQLFGDVWTEASADAITSLGQAKGELQGFEGATRKAGEAAEQTFSAQVKQGFREIQIALEPLGGVIKDLAEEWIPKLVAAIQSVSEWFQGLSEPMQNAVVIIGAIVAVIPILLVAFGALIAFLGMVVTGWGALATVIPVVGTFIATIGAPIAIAIAAFVALMLIIRYVINHWDEIAAGAKKLGEKIVKAFEEWKQGVKDRMQKSVEDIKRLWNSVMEFFRGINLAQIGRDIIQGLVNGIGEMKDKVMRKARDIADSVGKTIKSALKIGSPSKLMMELGQFTGEGLALGLENTIGQISSMSKEMASASIPRIDARPAPAANLQPSEKSLTVNINSPKALDIREANKVFNQTLNKMSLMW